MSAGKGDTPRPVDMLKYTTNYELIFRHTANQPQDIHVSRIQEEAPGDAGNTMHVPPDTGNDAED